MSVSVGANPPALPSPPPQAAGEQRSTEAQVAAIAGVAGGGVVTAIDVARVAKKLPESLRARTFDPSLGKLGRLPTAIALAATAKPFFPILDPTAPAVASAASLGRSFTKWDARLMRASVLIGTSLAGVQLIASGINFNDAFQQEGTAQENVLGTKSGRAGLALLGGGLFGAGVFAAAMRQTAGQATGMGRVLAAAKAPLLTNALVGVAAIGVGSLIGANELGYLDAFGKDETRSTQQVLADAAHGTPVLNDANLRTAVLGGASAASIGAVATKAITSGRGVAALKAGHWIAGAASLGLLGAQLLGAFKGLDEPS